MIRTLSFGGVRLSYHTNTSVTRLLLQERLGNKIEENMTILIEARGVEARDMLVTSNSSHSVGGQLMIYSYDITLEAWDPILGH